MSVIMHADDYGYNIEVSRDILECALNGTLHGISIMPNSPYFEESMQMFKESGLKLSKTIHFSISEGPSLCDKDEVSLLVDEHGMFDLSFFKLLLMSFGPKRRELAVQLKKEIKAQYEKALPYLEEVNIDSHVHYHMIPLVLKTILEVVKESGREITYLRIPSEPIGPFLKHRFKKPYDKVNFVKNIVLNFLDFMSSFTLKKYRKNSAVFFGIVMSGHMDIDRVSALLLDFKKIAEKKNMDLEVLAHPGRAISKDTVLDKYNEEYMKAPLSPNRHIEKQMFMEIGQFL